MEITLSRKTVLFTLVAVTAIFAVAATLWTWSGGSAPTPTPTATTAAATPSVTAATPSTNLPEEAAVAFAKAFYTVDYQDHETWLAGLKAASTDDGYTGLTRSVAPVLWPEFEEAQTVTPADAISAQDAGLVLEGVSPIGGPWQIRDVSVKIDPAHLWPTMKTGEFIAQIMLGQQNSQWKFVSFMSPEQIEQIKKGQEQKP